MFLAHVANIRIALVLLRSAKGKKDKDIVGVTLKGLELHYTFALLIQ